MGGRSGALSGYRAGLGRVESKMLAWKMVNAADAYFIELGCLKLGSLSSYKSLENGRADDRDGIVTIETGVLMHGIPEHEKAMERNGFAGSGLVINSRVEERQPTTFAFCMSETGCRHDRTPHIPKAIFRVNGVRTLARLLSEKYQKSFRHGAIGRVQYAVTTVNALEPQYPNSSAFLKDIEFQEEREIRIAWRASDPDADTLYTTPDPEIASLFTRVSPWESY
jgi:hypothetical protein